MKKTVSLLLLFLLTVVPSSQLYAESSRTKECIDLAISSAAKAQGKVYLVENKNFIVIGNARMAAGFSKKKLELIALIDISAGGYLMAAGPGALWEAGLAKNKDKKQIIFVRSSDEAEKSYALNRTKESVALYINSTGISSGEENNILRTKVCISADTGSRYLCWKINIDCQSKNRGLWNIDFPVIESILPMGEAEKTKLFVPQSIGVVHNNFFIENKKSANTIQNQQPSKVNAFRYRGPSMQFSSVYGPTGGLYLATQDGNACDKKIIFKPGRLPQTLTFYIRNIPDNQGAIGINYRMPYEFVMTSFKGDWFTASKMYREWAIKQVWCSKGPLYKRKDVPLWFKELGFWMLAWEQKGITGGKEYQEKILPKVGPDFDQTLDDIKKNSEYIGVPIAVHFYGWHNNRFDRDLPEYFPPLIGKQAFKSQIKKIHDMGVRIMPYINGHMWNTNVSSWKKLNAADSAVKDHKGRVKTQGSLGAWMCTYTELWQNKMMQITKSLLDDYGTDGVYYDQVSHTGYKCFDAEHGHPVGANHFEGQRELLIRCREAARKINPDAIMTGECLSEVLMDCLDGLLLSMDQSKAGTVPAFQAVYHDYFILFCNMNLNYKEHMKVTPMVIGESFTSGDQLGWFNIWHFFTPNHPRFKPIIEKKKEETRLKLIKFIRDIVHLRYYAGKKFLVYGEMLTPLILKNQRPYIKGWWQKFKTPEIRKLPAVMHSVWKAPDGSLGLVFCNIAVNEKYTVEFDIDLDKYGLAKADRYVLLERMIDGSEKLIQKYDTRHFSIKLTVEALTGHIYEIRGKIN